MVGYGCDCERTVGNLLSLSLGFWPRSGIVIENYLTENTTAYTILFYDYVQPMTKSLNKNFHSFQKWQPWTLYSSLKSFLTSLISIAYTIIRRPTLEIFLYLTGDIFLTKFSYIIMLVVLNYVFDINSPWFGALKRQTCQGTKLTIGGGTGYKILFINFLISNFPMVILSLESGYQKIFSLVPSVPQWPQPPHTNIPSSPWWNTNTLDRHLPNLKNGPVSFLIKMRFFCD